MMKTQTKAFKTEVSQLLDLVIHSLYSKKEIFLRELISNSSDAIDRLRFEALTDSSLLDETGEDFQIRIEPNKKEGTLTIEDNGVGMSAEEIEANLGTIASSGTKAFMEALKESADKPEMIGQFGVGFYAAFMVAEKVDVVSRRKGRTAVRWSSRGDGTYEIGTAERETTGTTITLILREDQKEYMDEWRIRDIVRRYSDYIAYPILLAEDPSAEKPAEKTPAEETDQTETEEESAKEPRILNSMKAIWKRGKDEVESEELNTFYKHISHDFQDPIATIQVAAEGATEFRALLFIPAQAPFDLFMGERKHGLQLYVRSVFIGDDIQELLPSYLRFARGVVESGDLPLNVSREILQDDAIIRRIRKALVTRILGRLEEMRKNKPDDYKTFYDSFGRVLKEGLHEDFENLGKLKELVEFPSTFTENDNRTGLKDYVSRMPSSQAHIYTLSADNVTAARNSPLLEAFEERGYEVLFFVDPIDEWVAQRLTNYDEKPLRAIDRGELDLDADPEKENDKKEEEKDKVSPERERYAPLLDILKNKLADDVKEVRLSKRLTESVCCLVADEHGPTAHMERILRSFNQDAPAEKRILEINAKHPLAEKMLAMASADPADARLADYIELIHAQALLSEGSPIKNPTRFSKLLSGLMADSL